MRLDAGGTGPPLSLIAAQLDRRPQPALIMVCGSRNDTVVTTSHRSPTVVDLLMAYTKRLNLLSELVSVVERLRVKDAQEPEKGHSARSERAPRVWRSVIG